MEDRGPTVFTVTLVLSILATVFVGLRLCSKWYIVKRNNSDDVLVVISWLIMIGMSASIMYSTRAGLGAPDSMQDASKAIDLKKGVYAFTILYNPALMATKTAVLLLYIRMAQAHTFLRYASYATLAIVDIAGIVLTFLNIFQCRPVSSAYTNADGTCLDVVTLYLSSAPINVLTDLAVLLLPLPILTKLRMEFRQKVALVATFTVGGFVTIVDVIRIAYLQNSFRDEAMAEAAEAGSQLVHSQVRPPNFLFNISYSLMFSAVEVTVGLMCCCVLVLKPLIMKVIPKLLRREDASLGSSQRIKDERVNGVAGQRSSNTRYLEGTQPNGIQGLSINIPTVSFNGGVELMPMRTATSQVSFASDHGSEKEKGKGSPQSNLHTILEAPRVPGMPFNDDQDEEDDGMDFFQMLASDPSTIAPNSYNSMSSRPLDNGGINALHLPPSPPMMQTFLAPPLSAGTSPIRSALLSLPRPSITTLFSIKSKDRQSSPPSAHQSSAHPAQSQKRPHGRRHTGQSLSGGMGQAPTHTFFDFVNMNGRKPLTELTAKEAWWPVVFVSVVFWLWGFAYGLIGTLNSEIISLLDYTPSQSIALASAYWQGYVCGPLVIGYWVVTRAGFKATFMAGLSMYAIGAMAFWPSSVLRSYPGFYISNFLIASGLSVLEIAANPFIALAGPGELSEARLCFAQGIQAVGGALSPILAQKALFQYVDGANLFRVQWCYLAVALFVAFLAVVFFYVPLSEASDSDLDLIANNRLRNAQLEPTATAPLLPFLSGPRVSAKYLLLVTGVLGIWLYVGVQETVAYYWSSNTLAVRSDTDPFWDSAIGHALFAIGRFVGAGMTYYGIPPIYALAFFMIGTFVTSLLGMVLPPGRGALAMMVFIYFFESAIFPLIFAMTLRNMGRLTKLAGSALVIAISGGTVWPSITFGVRQRYSGDVYGARRGMIVIVVVFGASILIPIMWNSDVMRRWIDPKWSGGKRTSLSSGADGTVPGSESGETNGTASGGGVGGGVGQDWHQGGEDLGVREDRTATGQVISPGEEKKGFMVTDGLGDRSRPIDGESMVWRDPIQLRDTG